MGNRTDIVIALKRKILTAVLGSLLFALAFSIPGGFQFNGFMNMYYINFLIVITYGVTASFISDWISGKVSKKVLTQESISFLLHCFFGLGLAVLGLVSSILFFIVDRLLKKVKISWTSVAIALGTVVLVFMIMINIEP